jgi:hypothetical protein
LDGAEDRRLHGGDGDEHKEERSMKDYLNARRKMLAASLPQLAAVLVLWAISGEYDRAELTLTITAVLSAFLTERVPNKDEA